MKRDTVHAEPSLGRIGELDPLAVELLVRHLVGRGAVLAKGFGRTRVMVGWVIDDLRSKRAAGSRPKLAVACWKVETRGSTDRDVTGIEVAEIRAVNDRRPVLDALQVEVHDLMERTVVKALRGIGGTRTGHDGVVCRFMDYAGGSAFHLRTLFEERQ